ncbi:MAG: PASTA domain-containing protein [Muribaculaceae bacterium]|nr:PASTA domain-containing protein [Muribaculaceae bacterium]
MAENKKFSVRDFYNSHPIISTLILICVATLLLLWGATIFMNRWTMHGSTSVVPDIRNKTYTEARELLAANNLNIEINDSVYDRDAAPGTVVESWPKAGAVVKEGRQVYVTITAFSPKQVTISMPLTGNVSSRQAMSYLRGIGITDIRLESVPSEFPDLVMGARYGDTPLSVGSVIPVTSTVTLEVGSGPVEPVDSLATEELDVIGETEMLEMEN